MNARSLRFLGVALVALCIGLFAGACGPVNQCESDADCPEGESCATDSALGGAMTCRDFGF